MQFFAIYCAALLRLYASFCPFSPVNTSSHIRDEQTGHFLHTAGRDRIYFLIFVVNRETNWVILAYQTPCFVSTCRLSVSNSSSFDSLDLKETLVSFLQLCFCFIFIWREKKITFTGICAIFDLNCHVVDQTVYCINKWQVVWKQQNHQCLPLRYV